MEFTFDHVQQIHGTNAPVLWHIFVDLFAETNVYGWKAKETKTTLDPEDSDDEDNEAEKDIPEDEYEEA